MAKEICPNCNAKMTRPVPFCPVCSRPTAHASEAEHLEWDLRQWRTHVERSVGGGSTGSVALRAAQPAAERPPVADLRVVHTPDPVAEPLRTEKRERRKRRLPKLSLPKAPAAARPARGEDRVIVLDADDPFAYTACTSCERSDWIVRYGRNDDATYNYWCVRCSRSFKSGARLRQAFKPFIASGSVIGTLIALTYLMR